MKKVYLMFICCLFLLVGCKKEGTSTDGSVASNTEKPKYKIGIMTGTVSQGEEEYRAAEKLKKEFGDLVEHVTYPDKFTAEQETTISNLKLLASDPDVKAIIVCQAINGVAAAFNEIKDMRDDILLIAGEPHEDPLMIADASDIGLQMDQTARGNTIMEKASNMGAKTFVHYSFPRHMAIQVLAARRDSLKLAAEQYGLEFIEVDAPDPTSDAGVTGAQQFILEDVPRQVEKYGKDVAFFNTNCAMQEPLIKMALETGAMYPEQCCPSPYHAYPSALGISIPEDKVGDIDYLIDETRRIIAEKGGTGKFGSWVQPANVSIINSGFVYAKDYAEGKIEKVDVAALERSIQEVTGDTEGATKLRAYEAPEKTLNNLLLFGLESVIY